MAPSSLSSLTATAAAFLLASASTTTTVLFANAETITLPWCKPAEPGPYEPRQAKVGDTVVFDWENIYHNVLIYPSGDCLDTLNKEFISESPGASYTFTAEDVGVDKNFVCSVSDHCYVGQFVTFSVVPEDEDVEYITSTPCGEGFLGEPEPVTLAPLETEAVAESAGNHHATLSLVSVAVSVAVSGIVGGNLLV